MAALLAVVFLFVALFGPFMAFEIEHSHHGEFGHSHEFSGFHHADATPTVHAHSVIPDHCEHDRHDHSSFPCGKQRGEHTGPGESDPPKHSHVVQPLMDVSVLESVSFVSTAPVFLLGEVFFTEAIECPDGPFFALEKPPQLV